MGIQRLRKIYISVIGQVSCRMDLIRPDGILVATPRLTIVLPGQNLFMDKGVMPFSLVHPNISLEAAGYNAHSRGRRGPPISPAGS